MIGLGLSVVQIAVRQLLGFDPKSLFAASEPGVWYDPSDFSTMFQDAAGTTPVTAVEQPVGLILDKSKGLVLGPELVTNGDFSNGTTGWNSSTIYTSTSSVVDGVFRVNSTTNYGLQLQPISCVVGRAYVITGQARRGTVLSAAIGASANANGSAAIALATTTSNDFVALRCQFVATSTTMYVVLGGSAGNPSGYHEYDNISVRELPGNHATQTTSTSRPVLSARYNLLTKTEQFDDGVWATFNGATKTGTNVATAPDGTSTADAIRLSSAADSQVFQATATVAATYNLTCYVKRNSASNQTFRLKGTTAPGSAAFSDNLTATDTWQQFSLTLVVTQAHSGNISISADTLGNTSDLLVWGASLVPANQSSIPYQRVNTATDYDADPSKFKPYLRFDGIDDWLVTPTITPGTDKAQVFAGVRKLSDAAVGIVAQTSAAITNSGSFYIAAPNQSGQTSYGFATRGTSLSFVEPTTFQSPITNVLTGIGDISGDSAILRVNGTQAASSTADQGTGNYLAYPLYIGRRGGTSLPFNGHLYGLIVRFGANLPAGTIASTETWLNQRTGAY